MEQAPLVIAFGVVLVTLLLGAMIFSWTRKRRRQSDYPALPEGPETLTALQLEAPGEYVSTTSHGDWLDRIVVHSLAFKSKSILRIGAEGVLITRTGAPEIFIDRNAITEVELTSGAAGKFVEREGLLVISWTYGEREVDTAFRFRKDADKKHALTLLNPIPNDTMEEESA